MRSQQNSANEEKVRLESTIKDLTQKADTNEKHGQQMQKELMVKRSEVDKLQTELVNAQNTASATQQKLDAISAEENTLSSSTVRGGF